jgi:hypothetical protein
VAFDLQVLLADPRLCPRCDAAAFLHSTRALFPGVRVRRYEAASPAGRELAQRYGVEQLPAYILSREFARTARFARVRYLLLERGDAYLVRPRVAGSTYWQLRPPRPGRLDLFLPAGAFGSPAAARRAAMVEDEILRLWSDRDAAAGTAPGGPDGDGGGRRLHLHHMPGPADGDTVAPEHLRRLCVRALYPERYAAYARARNAQVRGAQADSTWPSAAAAAGLDAARLARCAAGPQGLELAAAEEAMADSLSLRRDEMSALLENRILARGIQPEELAELWHAIPTP